MTTPTAGPPTAGPPTAEPSAAVSAEPVYQLTEYAVPAGVTRTTSRPPPMAGSGTRPSDRESSASSTRRPARSGRSRSAAGSAPHGVIVGPDGAPWITDGGLNAIVRVDPQTERVDVFPLPADRSGANLNTAAFDAAGILWFTGQTGVYGRLDPGSRTVEVFDAPRGRGPYGITRRRTARSGTRRWPGATSPGSIARRARRR